MLERSQARGLTYRQGGYNLTSISKSALAVTRTLIGEKPERLQEAKATEAGVETVQMVAMHQAKYWPSIFIKDPSKGLATIGSLEKTLIPVIDNFAKTGADRMHGTICLEGQDFLR